MANGTFNKVILLGRLGQTHETSNNFGTGKPNTAKMASFNEINSNLDYDTPF
jgi:hypothetical protein